MPPGFSILQQFRFTIWSRSLQRTCLAGSQYGDTMTLLIYAVPVAGLIGLGFSFWQYRWIASQDPGGCQHAADSQPHPQRGDGVSKGRVFGDAWFYTGCDGSDVRIRAV
ncbi:MAG UNVERIFIED_CONTAM: hypothetical protein LVR18_22050 [Planctomycetaceae bacterium]